MRFAAPRPTLPGTQRFDGGRQALFDEPGALGGEAAQVGGRGSGREHQRERNQRETEPGDAGREQHVVRVFDIQAEGLEGYVLQGLDVLEDREREEEEKDR